MLGEGREGRVVDGSCCLVLQKCREPLQGAVQVCELLLHRDLLPGMLEENSGTESSSSLGQLGEKGAA